MRGFLILLFGSMKKAAPFVFENSLGLMIVE